MQDGVHKAQSGSDLLDGVGRQLGQRLMLAAAHAQKKRVVLRRRQHALNAADVVHGVGEEHHGSVRVGHRGARVCVVLFEELVHQELELSRVERLAVRALLGDAVDQVAEGEAALLCARHDGRPVSVEVLRQLVTHELIEQGAVRVVDEPVLEDAAVLVHVVHRVHVLGVDRARRLLHRPQTAPSTAPASPPP